MPRVAFGTVVWGADFTRSFLEVCIASQLTSGNLPHFVQRTDSVYRIYTTSDCAEIIRHSEVYKRLLALMSVEIAVISGIRYARKYRAMTECHAHFIKWAARKFDGFFIEAPDVVWADGSLARALEIFESGKRMLVMGMPRLAKETFVPALLERYSEHGILQPIPPRELVRMALDHLHPVTAAQSINPGRSAGTELGEFVWQVNQEGLLVRTFRGQLVMVNPVDRNAVPIVTIDTDYALKACPNPADIYVVHDSDDICLVDFTSVSSIHAGQTTKIRTLEEVVDWAKGDTDALHREFVKHRLRFHWTDCSGAWEEVERESEAVVEAILVQLGPPPAEPQVVRRSSAHDLSIGFLWRKLKENGALWILERTFAALIRFGLRTLYGSDVLIKMAPTTRPALEEGVRSR